MKSQGEETWKKKPGQGFTWSGLQSKSNLIPGLTSQSSVRFFDQ